VHDDHPLAGINHSLNRWDAFTSFLEDGRLCMSKNAAERELRAVAVGRNWTFADPDERGRPAPAIYTLSATAKLGNAAVEPHHSRRKRRFGGKGHRGHVCGFAGPTICV
jgi:hypothetical protein